MRILIVGDIHTWFNVLLKVVEEQKPEMVFQVGDFGYWPEADGKYLPDGRPQSFVDKKLRAQAIRRPIWRPEVFETLSCPVYFCDGNHEDHERLLDLPGKGPRQVAENVWYMSRGQLLELPDGRTVMFVGGASSVDKRDRLPGHDWFYTETISQEDVWELPDARVDICISHTCPTAFFGSELKKPYHRDPSSEALDYVLEAYRPTLWYFGHFHRYATGFANDCRWTCLHKADKTGWYAWLK